MRTSMLLAMARALPLTPARLDFRRINSTPWPPGGPFENNKNGDDRLE